ncbi:exported hypothetical protein [Xanthomonas citri pv. citri]|nr:exported hypothetical protein [Xanthomonas citri pv. citri]CEE37701.1 exported hypothetical protein [Xanthomonas citri pv. citri]CEE58601.1 exported hypothetical protein [Xanthomonas citri pv. citri]CEE66975.1 exported hypothetical protein [Xanthomonas citri pv. citri]CEH40963.1 exported hypothetical protein [Xanthomonas citri pv. citri]
MLTVPALLAPMRLQGARLHARAWLLLAAVLICGTSWAQTYSFRDYAQADGLQGMTVNSLLEDRQGVVWVGTELALHRFERERFTPVGKESGLDARYIRALGLDAAGRLWVSSANGLFVREGNDFVQVLRDGKPIRADSGNVVAAYADGVVVVSENSLLRLSPSAAGGWSVHPLPLQLDDGRLLPAGRALLADGTALWASCGQHVCRIDAGGKITLLAENDGVPERQWRAIFRDRLGTLWLRGGGLVLSRAAGEHVFRNRPAPAGTRFDTLSGATTLSEDAQGRLLTRSDRGLVRWEGDHWRYFGQSQGLQISPMVGPLMMQSTGQLWIGTRGLGVQRWLGYGAIEHWDESQGLAEAPTWVSQRLPSGELLVGGDAGSNVLDPRSGRMQPWTLENGQPLLQSISIALSPDDGAAWVARSSGAVARRDPRSGKTTDVLQLDLPINRLMFDTAGTLWITTPRGLYRVQRGTPPRAERETALPAAFVGDIDLDPQGRLWASTREGLFLQAKDGHWQRVQVRGDLPSQDFFLLDFSADGEVWLSLRDTGLWHGRLQADGILTLAAVDDPLVARVMPFILPSRQQGPAVAGQQPGPGCVPKRTLGAGHAHGRAVVGRHVGQCIFRRYRWQRLARQQPWPDPLAGSDARVRRGAAAGGHPACAPRQPTAAAASPGGVVAGAAGCGTQHPGGGGRPGPRQLPLPGRRPSGQLDQHLAQPPDLPAAAARQLHAGSAGNGCLPAQQQPDHPLRVRAGATVVAGRSGHCRIRAAEHRGGDRSAALAHRQTAAAQARTGAAGGQAHRRAGTGQARSGSGARRTLAQGHPRRTHRPAQPRRHPGRVARDAAACRTPRASAGGGVDRSGPLQTGQRPAWPSGRRRRPGWGRPPYGHADARRRPHRPLRRRRIAGAAARPEPGCHASAGRPAPRHLRRLPHRWRLAACHLFGRRGLVSAWRNA